ncbi:probable type III restriction-modification enzyme HindVI Mod subunit, partial [Oncorhynchus nerka]|uniref:probable type III restriction-modification enzyme HindVI Mod subunit n=1 Tax=Oncorhynchus nerka TaxID=8023 RepID=UPI0031B83DB7
SVSQSVNQSVSQSISSVSQSTNQLISQSANQSVINFKELRYVIKTLCLAAFNRDRLT